MSVNHTFAGYDPEDFHDELFSEGEPRPGAKFLVDFINALPSGRLIDRQKAIERALYRMGITFAVYGDERGTEKIFPFDIVPRIIDSFEWNHIAAGLKQRTMALNHFIDDVYHDQHILNAGVVPKNPT